MQYSFIRPQCGRSSRDLSLVQLLLEIATAPSNERDSYSNVTNMRTATHVESQVEVKENATTPVTTKQQLFTNQKYIQTNVKRTIKLGK